MAANYRNLLLRLFWRASSLQLPQHVKHISPNKARLSGAGPYQTCQLTPINRLGLKPDDYWLQPVCLQHLIRSCDVYHFFKD